ncbi:response regulator transcription factor [Porticoccus sp.]|uniref:response regulator transcription factor n=1 Tax=Porticoccus sp. TaxID=2024853 RepID=UPI003F69FC21
MLTILAEGLQKKQIAYGLDVTEATIKTHMTAIFRKLGVRSRTKAVLAIGKLNLESAESRENEYPETAAALKQDRQL